MTKRIFTITTIAAMALFCCLALAGCGTEDMDEDMRRNVGLALGLLIVAASGIGFVASNRRFNRNKHQRIRRYRSRSNTKSRKRK